jgi:hypothetical protein
MWNGGGEGHEEGSVELYNPPRCSLDADRSALDAWNDPPHMPHSRGKNSEVLSKHALFLLNLGVLLLPALANTAHLALLVSYTLRCAYAIVFAASGITLCFGDACLN